LRNNDHKERRITQNEEEIVARPGPDSVRISTALKLEILRHTVKEIYNPGLQRILRGDYEEPILTDQLLEDFRSMSQMVCRDADVRPNGLPHQSIRVGIEACFQ